MPATLLMFLPRRGAAASLLREFHMLLIMPR